MFYFKKYRHTTDLPSIWRPGELSAGSPFPLGSTVYSAALGCPLGGLDCEALTLLPEEGCNLVLKSFSSSSFCFHAFLCSFLLNSLDMKILFINYLRI